MNKNLIVTAILLGAASAASAQSNVTIYGIVDASITGDRGGATGSVNKVESGAASVSRIGFKGNEDLGDGVSAIFTLETGYKVDDGTLDATNTLFNRQAFVGLKSNTAGTVTIGRQYTAYHNALAQIADPFGTGYAGGSKNLFPDAGTAIRTSNTIMYSTPVFAGVSADASYATGEQAGNNDGGRIFGGSVGYANGPFNVRVAYLNRNTDTLLVPAVAATATTAAVAAVPASSKNLSHNTLVAANYDFGVVKAYFGMSFDKGPAASPYAVANAFGYTRAPIASTDGNEFLVGLSAPVGTGSVLASYQRKNDKTVNNQDASGWGVAYLYPLSKRSNLYAAYGSINNKNGAGYTIQNNGDSTGTGDKGYNLGFRTMF